MTDDENKPRHATEIPEWEIEEMIRDVIGSGMRSDIAAKALAWLDERVDAYKRLNGSLQ
jgi:hypothetical protein